MLRGIFSAVGGKSRAGLAAVSAADGGLLDLATSTDISYPSEIISSGLRLWAGVTLAGGVQRNNIAAVDVRTGQAIDWQVDLGPANGAENGRDVNHLLTLGDKLLIAGAFSTVAGELRQNIAAVDAVTGRRLPWTASFERNTNIRQLVAQGNSAYVVGDFTSWGGQPRAGVARLDAASLSLQDWSLRAPAAFNAMAIAPTADRVYVAGGSSGAAAFDAGTGAQIAWDPRLSSASVRDIAAVGGTVYLMGKDIVVPGSGAFASGVRIDSVTGIAARWLSDDGSRSRLFQSGSQLFASRCSLNVQVVITCVVSEIDAATGAERAVLASFDAAVDTLSSDELSGYAGGAFGRGAKGRPNLQFFGR